MSGPGMHDLLLERSTACVDDAPPGIVGSIG
jgi:hypothetical protein